MNQIAVFNALRGLELTRAELAVATGMTEVQVKSALHYMSAMRIVQSMGQMRWRCLVEQHPAEGGGRNWRSEASRQGGGGRKGKSGAGVGLRTDTKAYEPNALVAAWGWGV